MTHLMQDILKLSAAERILIVEAIWDSIAVKEEDLELSESTKQLLDERLDQHRKNPEGGSSWESVRNRIKKSLWRQQNGMKVNDQV